MLFKQKTKTKTTKMIAIYRTKNGKLSIELRPPRIVNDNQKA